MYKFNKSDFEQQVKQVRDDDGNRYGMRLKCGSEFFRLNKKKAKIYDSFKLFE